MDTRSVTTPNDYSSRSRGNDNVSRRRVLDRKPRTYSGIRMTVDVCLSPAIIVRTRK